MTEREEARKAWERALELGLREEARKHGLNVTRVQISSPQSLESIARESDRRLAAARERRRRAERQHRHAILAGIVVFVAMCALATILLILFPR